MSNQCNHCASAAHDLVTARAQANRIRVETQQQLNHVLDCLAVTLSEREPAAWIAACEQYLRAAIRDLDKLPRN